MTPFNKAWKAVTAAITAENAGTAEITAHSIIAEMNAVESRQALEVCFCLILAAIEMLSHAYGLPPTAFLEEIGRLNAEDELETETGAP